MRNKYHNQKVKTSGGKKFDSRLELKVYSALQRNPIISSIERQVPLELQAGFRKCPKCGQVDPLNKKPVRCPLCMEKMIWIAPITYVADFLVTTTDKRRIVVEAKGQMTETARIKLKIFQRRWSQYPLRVIRCVKGGQVDV